MPSMFPFDLAERDVLKKKRLPSWWWHHTGRPELRGSKNIAPPRWQANSTCHCHPLDKGERLSVPLFAMISDCQCLASRFHFVKAAKTRSASQHHRLYVVMLRRDTSQVPSSLGMELNNHPDLAPINLWLKAASCLEFQVHERISCTLWLHQHYPLHIAMKHWPDPQVNPPNFWATVDGHRRILIAIFCFLDMFLWNCCFGGSQELV